MRLLVTGFEPFNGQSINPSWETVSLLANESFNADIRLVRLPVEWIAAPMTLVKEINSFKPDCVLMVGQAGGREGISIERIAYNDRTATIADNTGLVLFNSPICEGGENSLMATYPYEAVLNALTKANIKADYSFDAGRFICNLVLYTALNHAKSNSIPMSSGFIHLPYLPGQVEGAPCMSLSEQTLAIKLAVGAIINSYNI